VQTAIGAVLAWVVATAVLPEEQPIFASIAAVISLGAAFGQRGRRTVELVGGVVLGIGVAELIVAAIGTGPLQIGLLVLLAMSAAVLLGGGALLISEAAISAILLASLEPSSGASPDRFLEALIGGGVALLISFLLFPPNPVVMVERAARSLLDELCRLLDEIAEALEEGDADRAGRALVAARAFDERLEAMGETLDAGRETATYSPARRRARGAIADYQRTMRQVEYAARNVRVLARVGLRLVRHGGAAPARVVEAVRDLAQAVRALAAQLDAPGGRRETERLARQADGHAIEILAERTDLEVSEVVGQVRSTAADLVRASRLDRDPARLAIDSSTEELLRGE
jgi:uncharacterized membrane protein YgaE (UPF0421/DUF939 family)